MKIYPKMNKNNTALLIIDVVKGCAHAECESPEINVHFSKIREMAPKLVKFVDDFRETTDENIIFINITPWTKEYLPENIQELYTDPGAEYYADEEDGDLPQEFYEIKPKEKDLIITKNTYDAFANPELEKVLKERGIQYLVVVGIFTEGCVLATVANGFSRGFNFVMLEDLIETGDGEERQKLSELVKKRIFPNLYGKTITSEEFLKDWKDNQ